MAVKVFYKYRVVGELVQLELNPMVRLALINAR
jgi:hypothetical protein